jgi:phosphatidate cytidylyltransferase
LSRNLALRLAVAAVGIPALLAAAFYGHYCLLLFGLLLANIGGLEFAEMARAKNIKISRFFAALLPMIVVAAAYFNLSMPYALTASVFVCALLVVFKGEIDHFLEEFSCQLLPAIYLGLLSGIIIELGNIPAIGNRLLIFVFLTIWATDTAAYFGGSSFGKHKLAPAISPNKTWEGFFAGFGGSILAAVFSRLIFLDISWMEIIAMSLAACLFGQIGDLFESGLKRYFGVKDSSALLPGHGGILDRFDSLLFAAPTVYFIALFWR